MFIKNLKKNITWKNQKRQKHCDVAPDRLI